MAQIPHGDRRARPVRAELNDTRLRRHAAIMAAAGLSMRLRRGAGRSALREFRRTRFGMDVKLLRAGFPATAAGLSRMAHPHERTTMPALMAVGPHVSFRTVASLPVVVRLLGRWHRRGGGQDHAGPASRFSCQSSRGDHTKRPMGLPLGLFCFQGSISYLRISYGSKGRGGQNHRRNCGMAGETVRPTFQLAGVLLVLACSIGPLAAEEG